MEKICVICSKTFSPSKYREQAQVVCSDPVCQHKRQLENMKKWRRDNPHYFKQDELRGAYWRNLYRRRIKRWRKDHREYFKNYRERYKDRHKDYMREYMRRYRNTKKSVLTEPQGVDVAAPKIELQPPDNLNNQNI